MRSSRPGSDNHSLCIASGYRQFCPDWMAKIFERSEGQVNNSFGSQFLLASRELSELGHALVWITALNCELLRLHTPDLDRGPFRTKIVLSRPLLQVPHVF